MHRKLINAETVDAAGTWSSQEDQLFDRMTSHSFQYEITGDGTLTFEVYIRVGGGSWILSNTFTGFTKTSGPGGNGKDIVPLSLKPGDSIYIKATETVESDSCVLSLWLGQM